MDDRPTDSAADDADRDADRDLGLDERDVPPRTPRQRVRSGVVTGVVVLAAAAVIAITLVVTVRSVQHGIGGLFPQPAAALDRLEDRAADMPGVATASDLSTRQTEIFAGYDVTALVRARPGLTDDEQAALLSQLSALTRTESGGGVAVYAQVQFGDLRVAVSPDRDLTRTRLAVGQAIAAMGGVDAVHCVWASTNGDPIDDSAAHQVVTVGTTASDADYPALAQSVTAATKERLPDAQVTITRASP